MTTAIKALFPLFFSFNAFHHKFYTRISRLLYEDRCDSLCSEDIFLNYRYG